MRTRKRFFAGCALEVLRYMVPYTDEPPADAEAEDLLGQAIIWARVWECLDPKPGTGKRGYSDERSSSKAVKLLIYREGDTEICEDIQVSSDRGKTYHCPLDNLP